MASWLAGPGSSPGRGHCVVFRQFTLAVPLSTGVYKYVHVPVGELNARVGTAMD